MYAPADFEVFFRTPRTIETTSALLHTSKGMPPGFFELSEHHLKSFSIFDNFNQPAQSTTGIFEIQPVKFFFFENVRKECVHYRWVPLDPNQLTEKKNQIGRIFNLAYILAHARYDCDFENSLDKPQFRIEHIFE